MAIRATPGADIPVGPTADISVITHVIEAKREAGHARRTRLLKNRRNVLTFLGDIDMTHKLVGQSREHLPKTSTSVEQFAAFIKRALVLGDWFSIEYGQDIDQPITPEEAKSLLECFLDNLPASDGKTTKFPTIMTDIIKAALLESLLIAKVHGNLVNDKTFKVEEGELIVDAKGTSFGQQPPNLVVGDTQIWRLRIDAIPFEHYHADPTGRGLYEIHTVERDLHQVVAMAEAGIYDMAAVEQLHFAETRRVEEHGLIHEHRRAEKKGQDPATPTSYRKTVIIDEYWGTLLGKDGKVQEENIVTAVANNTHLIRKPEENPFWHGESPFVVSPLTRVPFSTNHKALFDEVASLNRAMDEVYNLILDGGIASVWGTRQIRVDQLEHPEQVAKGVPQGTTLIVKATLPHNAKVLETITEGKVPPEAFAIFESLNQELNQAALTNDIRAGRLPQKEVLATEIVEAGQSATITIEGVAGDIENEFIEPLLRKSWLTIMQNANTLSSSQVASAVGVNATFALARLSRAELYATFAKGCNFKVMGLSATIGRAKEFQKFMALMQAAQANPILFRAFLLRFSGEKSLAHVMKALNIDPRDIEKDDEELEGLSDEIAQMAVLAQLSPNNSRGGTGPVGGEARSPNASANSGSGPEVPAEVNQEQNPLTGLV